MRDHPEGARGLIPMQGTAGGTLGTFLDWKGSRGMVRASASLSRNLSSVAGWLPGLFFRGPLPSRLAYRLSLVDGQIISRGDFLVYLRHLGVMDWRVFLETVLEADAHDAWDVLQRITIPTLVMAAERDLFTPLRLSQQMRETIPHCQLVMLEGGTHAAPLEQHGKITTTVDRFLRDRVYPDLALPPLAGPAAPRPGP